MNYSALKLSWVSKMKISTSHLCIKMWILLFLLGILREFCSATNDTTTDDITFEDLRALNFTCNYRNNCTEIRPVGDDLHSYKCMCDHHCVTYGACCLDSEFRMQVQNAHNSGVKVNCINTYGANSRSVYMVDSCKTQGTINDLCANNGEAWNDPFLLIPVTSKVSNITYKNYYCAVCNENSDTNQFIFWTIIVDDTFNSTLPSPVPKLKFSRALESWVTVDPTFGNITKVTISIEAPERPEVKYCKKDLITTCDRKWTNASVADKCEAYMSVFSIYDRNMGSLAVYKNPHCAICNFEVLKRYEISCLGVYSIVRHVLYEGGRRFVVEDTENKCGRNAVYDIFSKQCR
ncbi:uncharacterized protein TNCV_1017291 [Trichonephila clavipes]|uniref:SMB domain-containing protein n=1 Tax=Trichonephila clavipes TaxID=2585209 RepID=A0A8X6VY25_TRICX|nr:uncharacterized protein TNCV_1017291 [Trichonephila clavipes]